MTLFDAVADGKHSWIKDLIKGGCDVNGRDPRNQGIPLHFAAFNGDLKCAQVLIECGSLVDVGDSNGETPLHVAASEGQSGMVEFLLKAGANADALTKYGLTPLLSAVSPREKYSPKHLETTRILLDFGVDVNTTIKTTDGTVWNALNVAVKHITEPTLKGTTVKMLLAARIELRNINFDYTKEELNKLLLDYSRKGDILGVKAQLHLKADINCQSDDGWTPLHEAVTHSLELVEFLLSNGANPNAPTEMGYTPLMRAAGKGRGQVVECLLKHGAQKGLKDNTGKTAAQMARIEGHPDLGMICDQ